MKKPEGHVVNGGLCGASDFSVYPVSMMVTAPPDLVEYPYGP